MTPNFNKTEFAVLKGYLDTVFSIPWKKQKSAKIDIQRVRKELDHHHFGLDSVKTRILEHSTEFALLEK